MSMDPDTRQPPAPPAAPPAAPSPPRGAPPAPPAAHGRDGAGSRLPPPGPPPPPPGQDSRHDHDPEGPPGLPPARPGYGGPPAPPAPAGARGGRDGYGAAGRGGSTYGPMGVRGGMNGSSSYSGGRGGRDGGRGGRDGGRDGSRDGSYGRDGYGRGRYAPSPPAGRMPNGTPAGYGRGAPSHAAPRGSMNGAPPPGRFSSMNGRRGAGPPSGLDASFRLHISYMGPSRPQTLLVARPDELLRFVDYGRQLMYVHIKNNRYIIVPEVVHPEPPLERAVVASPAPHAPAPLLMDELRHKLRFSFRSLAEYAAGEAARGHRIKSKLIVRMGRQLFGARRGIADLAGAKMPAGELAALVSEEDVATTYEVNLPHKAHDTWAQVCLGQGWQHELEQPDRLGDKYKLHINLPGAAQEIVAGCSAVGRFLKLNVVKRDQVRASNLDIARPYGLVDLRVQMTAKTTEPASIHDELERFVSSITVCADNEQDRRILMIPAHPVFRVRRARRIRKRLFHIGDEQWALVHQNVQNFDVQVGETGVREMFLIEAQHLGWKPLLNRMFDRAAVPPPAPPSAGQLAPPPPPLLDGQQVDEVLAGFECFLSNIWKVTCMMAGADV